MINKLMGIKPDAPAECMDTRVIYKCVSSYDCMKSDNALGEKAYEYDNYNSGSLCYSYFTGACC